MAWHQSGGQNVVYRTFAALPGVHDDTLVLLLF
jgi:hypothetical protein